MATIQPSCVDTIRDQQRAWARAAGHPIDASGYCLDLKGNLFAPLHPKTRQEFRAGDGGELGKPGKRGKLQALHSSSALACNFFDHWRTGDRAPLQRALELPAAITDIGFERKFPTGIGPRSPNLDVVLYLDDGCLVGVESKFLEPYSPSARKNTIQGKYFPSTRRSWEAVGLPGGQRLAEHLRDGGISFLHLDAAQLLKHMLGLGHQKQPWQLLYLWFDPAMAVADEHRGEVAQFGALLGPDGPKFRAASYTEVFARLRSRTDAAHRHYIEYLADRYFASGVA